jgi:hypothetical protein
MIDDNSMFILPPEFRTTTNRGHRHQALTHGDNAVADYTKAIDLDPTNHLAH